MFFFVMLISLAVWVLCARYVYSEYFLKDATLAGQLGDLFGSVNSLFACLAFAGLVYTILLQRKELKETREEFIKQNATLRLQRFENTLFSLLSSRIALLAGFRGGYINSIDETVQYENGRELIQCANSELRERVKAFHFTDDAEVSENVSRLRAIYHQAIAPIESLLELYLSNLTAILKFIRASELLDADVERRFYFSIVRSQMGFEERQFLYYYMSIADPGKFSGKYIWGLRNCEIEFMFNEFSTEFLFHKTHVKLQALWNGFLNYEDEEDTEKEDFEAWM